MTKLGVEPASLRKVRFPTAASRFALSTDQAQRFLWGGFLNVPHAIAVDGRSSVVSAFRRTYKLNVSLRRCDCRREIGTVCPFRRLTV